MRLLFFASNPSSEVNLTLEHEVSALQRSLLEFCDDTVTLRFLPDLPIEDLDDVLGKWLPDVLHIAAHTKELDNGDAAQAGTELKLAHADRSAATLKPEQLHSWLSEARPPKLLVINACNSHGFAKELVQLGRVTFAIGSTAPISNETAVRATVTLYRRLARGESLAAAFRAARAAVEVKDDLTVSLELYRSTRRDLDPEKFFLVRKRRIGAQFVREDRGAAVAEFPALAVYDNEFKFRLYVAATHPHTSQVIFFTDDPSFIGKAHMMENDMSLLVRGTPDAYGTFWAHERDSYIWSTDGEHRLFAVGVTPSRESFSVSGSLLAAISLHYDELYPEEKVADVEEAIRVLKAGETPRRISPPRRSTSSPIQVHPEGGIEGKR